MAAIHVTLLTAEGCHYCEQAQDLLARLGKEWALAVEEIPLHSVEGSQRALRDGIVFPPGLYVDDSLFGYGRLSEAKLRRRLEEASAP